MEREREHWCDGLAAARSAGADLAMQVVGLTATGRQWCYAEKFIAGIIPAVGDRCKQL